MFANIQQLKDILKPEEVSRLGDLIEGLGDEPDSGEVYRALRNLYDHNEISLTSFCNVFNYLAEEEMPVLTYRSDSLDSMALGWSNQASSGDPKKETSTTKIAGHYKPLGKLGEGGSGEVLIARDTHLERRVALKRLKQFKVVPDHVRDRFINEAQVTAQLDHPNIIPVYGLQAVAGESLAYAMKLVRGVDLATLIEETRRQLQCGQKLDPERTLNARLELFLKVCDAIDFAHSKGVLHRDLKPTNIMIGRFHEVYVMDWGIAEITYDGKDRDERTLQPVLSQLKEEDKTQTAGLFGTPLYMSPEQAAGKPVDERSDQYTLGLILYELVCLKRAKGGTTSFEVVTLTMKGAREPVKHFQPRRPIPRALTAIINKATAYDPMDRYVNVRALTEDLRRYLSNDEILAKPDTRREALVRQISKNQHTALITILAALFLAVSSLVWSMYQGEKKKRINDHLAVEKNQGISRLVAATSDRARKIDLYLSEHENALSKLAIEATCLLRYGGANDDAVYDQNDFDVGRVPGQVASKAYKGTISADWPVFYTPDANPSSAARSRAKALSPLRHNFRSLLTIGHAVTKQQSTQLIVNKETSLVWAYISFEDGTMLLYPGIGNFPDHYDPRKRPWYNSAREVLGPHWFGLYHTLDNVDPELPCSVPITDQQGKLLGVASINISFDRIRKDLVPLSTPGVEVTYLVKRNGQVIVSSSDTEMTFAGDITSPQLVTEEFPHPEVLDMFANKQQHLEMRVGNKRFWFSCSRLETIGWYYIVQVDPKAWKQDP